MPEVVLIGSGPHSMATATPALSGTGPSRPDVMASTALGLALCVWVGHYLLLSALYHFVPDRPSDPQTLLARAVVCVAGISLCLGIFTLLHRWAGSARPWRLLLLAVGSSAVSAAVLVLTGKLAFLKLTPYYTLYPEQFFHPHNTGWVYVGYLWMMLTWSALYVGTLAIAEMRRRDAQLAATREAARQARLLALRLQINPHFLFNTLNTLAGFIVLERRQDSERIVLNLSRFFRHTLTHAPSQLVSLGDEIDMLRMYLEIEIARFPDRLLVSYDVPTECKSALVPGMIFLPLAENSIRHALARSEESVVVSIGARREGETLLLWLHDDGDPSENPGDGAGLGLATVRQQLRSLFGEAAALEAGPEATGGWRNRIRLPWRGTAR